MSEHPLEPDRSTLERWLAALSRLALDHVEGLEQTGTTPVLGKDGLALAEALSRPIGERPLAGGIDEIVAILARALAGSLPTTSPGYLAYVPTGGLPTAAMADLLAGCINRYTGIAAAAPTLVRLEVDTLRWLASEIGWGAEARGLYTSGASLAGLSAAVTARERAFAGSGDLRDAIAYTSDQVHHSVLKSVRLCGIPAVNLRAIAVDARFRMDPGALARAVRDDLGAGRRPFLVVSSAGTTNTGAVDPLIEVDAIARTHDLWHHVDGAYGGTFALCDEGRRRLPGLGLADSIALDPHKGLFMPYGIGCLLVREGRWLRAAHGSGASYLQDLDGEDPEPLPSPHDHGPELTRDFRGLRVWLNLMLFGATVFREQLAEKLALADRFHVELLDLIDRGAPIEIVDAPQLSTVPFRLARGAGEALVAWNARNAAWLRAINDRGRVYLSSTTLPVDDGTAFTLRVCVLSFRTHQPRMDACLEDLIATLPA